MSTFVRSGAIAGYEKLCASVGIDPQQLLEEAGLSASCLQYSELRIPIEKVARLLEKSAQLSGIHTFGLQLAHNRPLSALGPIALVLREQPTLRHVINVFNRYPRLRASAIALQIDQYNDVAILRQELMGGEAAAMRQVVELAIGMIVRSMQLMLGPDWRPMGVSFAHRASAGATSHARILQCPVQFDAGYTGVLCRPADMDRPLPFADPEMARHAQAYIDSLQTEGEDDMVGQVRQLLSVALPSMKISVEAIARELGISPRMLQRRLEEEGTTFSTLLAKVRTGRVLHLLASSGRGLSDIAELVGFTHQSTFSRWFRAEFGCSPSEFQRLHHR